MLINIFLIAAAAGAALTALLSPAVSLYLILPLALGYFAALIIIYLVAALAWSSLIDINKPVTGKVKPFYHWLVTNTVDGILRFARVCPVITGQKLLPENRRFLFVCNHLSRFDPMLCMARLSRYKITFISKPENLRIPIAGGFIHKCKFLAIDRENTRNALLTLNTAAEYIKSGELSVGVYPEGTRSKTGELLEFRDGVFKIARDTQAPIVVATVRNTDKVVKNFPWHSTRAEMHIIHVIEPEEYAGMRMSAISALVRGYIQSDLENGNTNNVI